MDEKNKALMMYRIMLQALKSDGIHRLLVTMENGELVVDVDTEYKKPSKKS